ncbi:MAG: hypothetical protein KKD39_00895 [Candidatus Altiarchaeota archaeon]|nr:hypothetical protein [Candidatus Altiarchaeota archaeon]
MDYKVKAVLDAASACLWDLDVVVEFESLRFFWVSDKLASEVDLEPSDLVGRFVGEVVLLDSNHVKGVFLRLVKGDSSFPLSFVSRGGKVVNLLFKSDCFDFQGISYFVGKLL